MTGNSDKVLPLLAGWWKELGPFAYRWGEVVMSCVPQRPRQRRYVKCFSSKYCLYLLIFFFKPGCRVREEDLGKWTIPGNIIGWQQSIYHLLWHPSKIKPERIAVLHVCDVGNCRWDLRMVFMGRQPFETQDFSPKVCLHVCMCLCIYVKIYIYI